jgi:hypothetical protein
MLFRNNNQIQGITMIDWQQLLKERLFQTLFALQEGIEESEVVWLQYRRIWLIRLLFPEHVSSHSNSIINRT